MTLWADIGAPINVFGITFIKSALLCTSAEVAGMSLTSKVEIRSKFSDGMQATISSLCLSLARL